MRILLTISIVLFLTLTSSAQGYLCAIGGGSENYNDWSDAPYSWIVQKSDSGKIIIISNTNATAWLPDYFMSLGADTAYNKTISSISNANLQSIYDELITAKTIFIRGGDQWDYIRLWKGTKVDSALNYIFQNGGVIAGTSAGAAVLGDIDFSARLGTVYPDEALLNPFNSYMQFESDFLNFVPGTLFDTHFIERARHGRLIAMLYNRYYTNGRNVIGAGIDDRTAICIAPDGVGEVMGSGSVSIFYKSDSTQYSPFTSGKYTVENLQSEILTDGWKYNFNTREITFVPSSAIDVDSNRPWQYPKTDFILTGSNDIASQLSTNLPGFLSSVNTASILVISHPGYSDKLNLITTYLAANSYNFSTLKITLTNLNSSIEAQKIFNATCFIFAGDSINVLSYLNEDGTLLSGALNNSVSNGKPVLFFGNCGKAAGEKYIGNTDTDIYASYRGKMTINDGLDVFGEIIFQPLLFDDSDYYENRMSAVIWGMMRNRKRIGVYLNNIDLIKISSGEKSISAICTLPYIVLDGRAATKLDSSIYRAGGSIGPRQVVAMNNLRISLTNYKQINYLLEDGKFDYLTKVEDVEIYRQPEEFVLYQNYPNPFNPWTTIKFFIVDRNHENHVSLTLYNVLGEKLSTLLDKEFSKGIHEIIFDGSEYPSGIYFYQLSTPNFSEIKPMVLIK